MAFSLEAGSPQIRLQVIAIILSLGGLASWHRTIWRGDSVGVGVYVSVMGSHSGRVQGCCFIRWLGWYFIRADIALDFDGAKYFDLLSSDLIGLSKTKNLKTSTVGGDWVQAGGRVEHCIGSRHSAFYDSVS